MLTVIRDIIAWICALVIVYVLIHDGLTPYLNVERSKLSRRDSTVVIHDSIPYPIPVIKFKKVYVYAKIDTLGKNKIDSLDWVHNPKPWFSAWGTAISVDYDTVTLRYVSPTPLTPYGFFDKIMVKPHPIWQRIDTIKIYMEPVEITKNSWIWDVIFFAGGIETFHIIRDGRIF